MVQELSPPQVVFVDTDIGDDIDDALALALLLCVPEVMLVGVSTVFGETHLRAQWAAYLLSEYGRGQVPVAPGQGTPLQMRHRHSGVSQSAVLTDQALVPPLSPSNGPELLIEMAHAYPGRLTLLCLGPLTNIAIALCLEPQLKRLLRQVMVMGGCSSLSWPWPDWNVRSDALAARLIMESALPITMIGWNVTRHSHLREHDVAFIRRMSGRRQQVLARFMTAWQQDRHGWCSPLPALHDPLVVAALCQPHLFRFTTMPVRVLTSGVCASCTIPRLLGGSVIRAARQVDDKQARSWMMRHWLTP